MPTSAGRDTFTYTLTGGSQATVSVTVTCAPDNPVVDTSAGSTSYTENAGATVIDGAVTVSDVDAGTVIRRATVQITGNPARRGGRHWRWPAPRASASFSGDADADRQRQPGGLPDRAT